MLKTAQALTKSGKYAPVGGKTKCNLYLNAFAKELWAYAGFFDSKTDEAYLANEMVDILLAGAPWNILIEAPAVVAPAKKAGVLWDAKFLEATQWASKGHLVVFGIKEAGHGHVGAILSNNGQPMVAAGSYKTKGLSNQVPASIAQAGKIVVPDPITSLNYGISADDAFNNLFVVAYLS